MRKLIRDRQVVEDHWQTVTAGEPVPAAGDVIVPLAIFLGMLVAVSSTAICLRTLADRGPRSPAPAVSESASS